MHVNESITSSKLFKIEYFEVICVSVHYELFNVHYNLFTTHAAINYCVSRRWEASYLHYGIGITSKCLKRLSLLAVRWHFILNSWQKQSHARTHFHCTLCARCNTLKCALNTGRYRKHWLPLRKTLLCKQPMNTKQVITYFIVVIRMRSR